MSYKYVFVPSRKWRGLLLILPLTALLTFGLVPPANASASPHLSIASVHVAPSELPSWGGRVSVTGDTNNAASLRPAAYNDSLAPDGSGTMAQVLAVTMSPGQLYNLEFSYTAAAGGTSGGTVQITIPDGWSAPQTADSAGDGYIWAHDCAGALISTAGNGPWTVTISNLTLATGTNCVLWYDEVIAPSSSGSYVFTTEEASRVSGTLTPLASSPSLYVYAPDGSGTVTVSPTSVVSGATGMNFTLTYTAASGGTASGVLGLDVPTGWTDPQEADSSTAGYVATDCGTAGNTAGGYGTSPNGVLIGGVTLAGGATCTITYNNVAAPTAETTYVFQVTEESTDDRNLTLTNPWQPVLTVTAPGGSPGTTTSTSTTATTTGTTTTAVAPNNTTPPSSGGAPPPATSTTTTSLSATTTATTAIKVTPGTTSTTVRAPSPSITGIGRLTAVVKAATQVRLHCAGEAVCRGILKIWYGHLMFGHQSYVVAAGTSGAVSVHLSAEAVRLLAKAKPRSLSVLETVVVFGGQTLRLQVRLNS